MASTKDTFPELYSLGEKYEKLGKAMKNDRTTLPQLTQLAFDCGLELQFRMTQRLPPPEATEAAETV